MKPVFTEIIDPWFKEELARGHRILTSLEGENPGGSIKDHMVKNELQSWLRDGILRPGDRVSELSAGSTAISLAHYCPRLGLRCVLYLPNTVAPELIKRLQESGAEAHLLNPASAYPDYEAECAKQGLHRFNQLFDAAKKTHYQKFGEQVRDYTKKLDFMVGAVGTGHSLLGLAHGAGIPAVSAEPLPPWKIAGCRNVEFERYGQADKCSPRDFSQRICLAADDAIFPECEILSQSGKLLVSPTFVLVLRAIKQILNKKNNLTVFAVGASNRRAVPISQLQAI